MSSSDAENTNGPRVVKVQTDTLSPWVDLKTISAVMPGQTRVDVYHALGQPDYVNVFCMRKDGQIPLVRQYRPVVDQHTWELPGGLRDPGENAATSAAREVTEETGYDVLEIIPLVEVFADIGRLTNRYFGFFAVIGDTQAEVDEPIETKLVTGAELKRMAAAGQIALPSNIGLFYLAGVHPRVLEICREWGFEAPPWISG